MELELINEKHILDNFDCGESPLNKYLLEEALKDTLEGLSKTYVMVDGLYVIGFYTIIYSTAKSEKLGKYIIGRIYKYPDVPTMKLGRLAVDKRYQSQGIGEFLLISAFLHTQKAHKIAGLTAIVVDSKEKSTSFYEKYRFMQVPNKPFQFFLPIEKILNYK